jgi:hypothetical protein
MKKYIEEILDLDKMKITLRTCENLSAHDLHVIRSQILKIERESAAIALIAVMKTILESCNCPVEWKGARTILIYKDGDRSNPGNSRSIITTSVIYKVIFCRFAEGLCTIHEEVELNIYDSEQKRFVSRRADCVEHAAIANSLINGAVQKKMSIYVLSHGFRHFFGSVHHDLIKTNMEQLRCPKISGKSFWDPMIMLLLKYK